MHPEKEEEIHGFIPQKQEMLLSVSCKKKEEEVGVQPRKRRRWGVHPAEKEEEMCECIPEKKKEQQEQRMRGEILD